MHVPDASQTLWRSPGKRKSQQEIPLQEQCPRPLLISSGTGLLSPALPVSPVSPPPAFLSTGRKKTDKYSAQACAQLGWSELQAAGAVSEDQQLNKLGKQTNQTPKTQTPLQRMLGLHRSASDPLAPCPPTLGLSVRTTVYT